MRWPEMLALPKMYSWDFLLAIPGFHHEGKGHQICLQNGLDGKHWEYLLDFCHCKEPNKITMLSVVDEEEKPKR